jgi:adenosylmethionine-8-amino-7-oxononanoate aminotransferase
MSNLWLPYTAHGLAPEPLEVQSAEGCTITLKNSQKLIDGIANWWTACHGHRHPHLVKAVQDQAAILPHIMMGGLAHEPAQKLASRLASITQLPRIFFSDSGSTAVEVALKMAVQYWRCKAKNTKKQKFLYFSNSYHGDTMGAMSVSDGSIMHSAFAGHMPMQYMSDIPSDEIGFEEFEKLLKDSANQLAGVIIEPLVQMAGGFKFHSADTLAEIYRLCKKHNILFIADEIATGFGRTGYMLACDEAGITPDIMCLGKALTGGMMTLAATCASQEIFDTFSGTAFMHGPTYMGNPIACAAANASLDLFETEPRLKQVAQIEEWLTELLAACRELDAVKDVRIKGALGVVQLSEKIISTHIEEEDTPIHISLRKKFIEAGVFIRPFGDAIYLAPPYVISKKELEILATAVYKVLETI